MDARDDITLVDWFKKKGISDIIDNRPSGRQVRIRTVTSDNRHIIWHVRLTEYLFERRLVKPIFIERYLCQVTYIDHLNKRTGDELPDLVTILTYDCMGHPVVVLLPCDSVDQRDIYGNLKDSIVCFHNLEIDQNKFQYNAGFHVVLIFNISYSQLDFVIHPGEWCDSNGKPITLTKEMGKSWLHTMDDTTLITTHGCGELKSDNLQNLPSLFSTIGFMPACPDDERETITEIGVNLSENTQIRIIMNDYPEAGAHPVASIILAEYEPGTPCLFLNISRRATKTGNRTYYLFV
jgi:hypothetical protein